MKHWIAALLLLIVGGLGAASAEPLRLDLVNEYPASSLPGEADRHFAERVAERLGDRLVIRPVPDAKSGLRSREQLAAVAAGTVAMADTFGGAIGDLDPVFALSSLPFLTPTVERARRLFELAEARYRDAFEKRNQKLLYISPWPASGLWTRRPVDGAAALKSLRVRTYDATGTVLFQRLSSSAEIVSFADLEPRFAADSIDAVLSSGDGGAGRQLWRRLPYFAAINYAVPLSFTTINLGVWNGLDAETRQALEAIGRETSERQWRAMVGRLETNYAAMRANGMTILDPVPQELAEALAGAADAALQSWSARASEADREVIRRYRSLVAAQ
jgi:TRAP-type transport system periplasmic protein